MSIRYKYPLDRSRYPYAQFSEAEFARRHAMVRDFMTERGLDCLLIPGGSGAWDRCWTNIRYLTNHIGSMEIHAYCIFPLVGDPTLAMLSLNGTLPDRIARSIIPDVRGGSSDHSTVVIERLQELELANGRIGVVEIDRGSRLPENHSEAFRKAFPNATFEYVGADWWRMRMPKSPEEVDACARAARLGEVAVEALLEQVRPGITEADVFDIIQHAVALHGGESPWMLLASTSPMGRPHSAFQRGRPLDRTVEVGDVILNELGPRDPTGYEVQFGRTITLGPMTDEYAKMHDIGMEAYHAIVDQLRPGKSNRDMLKAGMVIKEKGYEWQSPLVHGMLGGIPYDGGPIVGKEDVFQKDEVVLRPDTILTVQISVCSADRTRGIFIADSYVTTNGAPRRLHQMPIQSYEI